MEENLFKMYDDINLGNSSVCKECQEKTTNLRVGHPVRKKKNAQRMAV